MTRVWTRKLVTIACTMMLAFAMTVGTTGCSQKKCCGPDGQCCAKADCKKDCTGDCTKECAAKCAKTGTCVKTAKASNTAKCSKTCTKACAKTCSRAAKAKKPGS